MNRDIGIITSTQSFGNNYGAILQAYALSTILKESGYHPYIIKYICLMQISSFLHPFTRLHFP